MGVPREVPHGQQQLVAIKVQKLYNVAKKAGMKLEAAQMCIRIAGKPIEEDVFADDAALLA